MNRAIILTLLAFGLAAFTLGRSVSETFQGKAENGVLVQATASPGSLDFGDQVRVKRYWGSPACLRPSAITSFT